MALPQFSLHRGILPSGLRTLVLPVSGTGTVAFFLAVRTGSRNETPDIFGVSHFLEHLFFKGSKKRPTARAISGAVDGVGGEFNAATSKEWTVFYAKAAQQHAALIVDVVSDMVVHPLFRAQDIDRERGVIVEEINMYEDTPMRSIGDMFEETLFGRQPLAHTITGTKNVITTVPRSTITAYCARQYRAETAVACLAGNVDPAAGASLLADALRAFPRGRARAPKPFRAQFGRERVRVKEKKTDQAHVMIGSPGVAFLHRDRPAVDLLAAILGGGMSSRMFLEVRERRGLAYSVRTMAEYFVDTGHLVTQAGVDPGKLLAACRVMVRELARIREKRVGRAELEKVREFIKGKLLLSLEASDDVAQYAALQEVLLNRIVTPDAYFRLLDAVGAADIQRVARAYLRPSNLRLVAIGPKLAAQDLGRLLSA